MDRWSRNFVRIPTRQGATVPAFFLLISGLQRYVQSPAHRYPAVEALARQKGWSSNPFCGITEVWLENYEAMERMMQDTSDFAKQEALLKDEKASRLDSNT
jgi:hypothetical protein